MLRTMHSTDVLVGAHGAGIVNGIFMHRAIDVLELGKTEYIKDPLAFAWALIDRALAPLNHPCSHFDESGLIVLRTLHLLLLRYR